MWSMCCLLTNERTETGKGTCFGVVGVFLFERYVLVIRFSLLLISISGPFSSTGLSLRLLLFSTSYTLSLLLSSTGVVEEALIR